MKASTHVSETPLIERPLSFRWTRLFMGICCMVMIANLQYGWTSRTDAGWPPG